MPISEQLESQEVKKHQQHIYKHITFGLQELQGTKQNAPEIFPKANSQCKKKTFQTHTPKERGQNYATRKNTGALFCSFLGRFTA